MAYKVLATVDVNDVIGQLELPDYVDFNGEKVYCDTQRFRTFQKTTECVCCGITGTVVRYEKISSCKHDIYGNWHMNLYAKRDQHWVLMTVDHNKLRSLGGNDHHTNFNTMCETCNTRRGNKFENLEDFIEFCKANPITVYIEEKRERKSKRKNKIEERKNHNKAVMQEHVIQYFRHNGGKYASV